MNVTTLIFLGLAVVWAVVLLPELARKIAGSRHSDTIRSFNQQLSVLDRSGASTTTSHRPLSEPRGRSNVIDLTSRGGVRTPSAGPTAAPAPVSPWVRKRRQDILIGLGSVAVLTLLCAVAFGGVFLLAHLVADVLLVAYLVALAQVRRAPAAPVAAGRIAAMSEPSPIHRVAPAPRRIAN